MKECCEKLDCKREKVTIVSIDEVEMYPSIKFPLAKNPISFTRRTKLYMWWIKLTCDWNSSSLVWVQPLLTLKINITSMDQSFKKQIDWVWISILGGFGSFLPLQSKPNKFKEVLSRVIYRYYRLLVLKGRR